MLADVIARVGAEVPALKEVSGAAAWIDAMSHAPPLNRLPLAYVVPVADMAESNTRIGEVCQLAHLHFGVVLVVGPSVADARGGNQAIAIEGLRAAIKGALIGWQPPEAETPVQYTHGQMLGLDGQTLWWADGFQATVTLRG
jgi:hypothetical protein